MKVAEGGVGTYLHTGLVPVVAEADEDETLLLGEDGLIDGPSRVEVGQQIRHRSSLSSSSLTSVVPRVPTFLAFSRPQIEKSTN